MVRAIQTELVSRAEEWKNTPVETIYFGGGTPSLLSYEELMLILDRIYTLGNIHPEAEITLEANPDDLKKDKMQDWKKSPVNRFSIGVQSFYDDDLKRMNRAHRAEEADYGIKLAQDNGFENITIDLIYGIPGSSSRKWGQNLEKAFSLNIQHLSSYCLTIEEKTAFGKWEAGGQLKQVPDEEVLAQYRTLVEIAAARGFEHYEVSNFALPGKRSKHNSSYWQGKPYMGAGPSAHSFDGDRTRRWNISNNPQYLRHMTEGTRHYEEELLDVRDRYNEYVMTGLRTREGIDTETIRMRFGIRILETFDREITNACTREWMIQNGNTLRLTDEGMFKADRIASDLFLTENPEP